MNDPQADRDPKADPYPNADPKADPPQAEDPQTDPSTISRSWLLIVGGIVVVVLLAVVGWLATAEPGPQVGLGDPSLLNPRASAGSAGSDGLAPDGLATDGLAMSDAVDVLPEFTLGRFGGEGAVQVSDYLGAQPLVVNFWATWCAPCVAEMPDLQRVAEEGAGAFRLLGINTMDAPLNAEPFVEELGITYDLAVDQTGDYFRETGGFGMPTTLFVLPDGTVAYRQTGPLTLDQLKDLLAEHLDVRLS